MLTTHQYFRRLAARTGTGDHAAFRRLYALLAPATLAEVHNVLPHSTDSLCVVQATFCEVWWMCAFDVRCGAEHPVDIPKWIIAIARRRTAERRMALDFTTLTDDDRRTSLELETMLNGPDIIVSPAGIRQG